MVQDPISYSSSDNYIGITLAAMLQQWVALSSSPKASRYTYFAHYGQGDVHEQELSNRD